MIGPQEPHKRLSVYSGVGEMKIIAYIDGFNFYKGLTKDTPYRWCDLHKLCNLLLPEGNLQKIKLFAAYSKDFLDKPGQAHRQHLYLEALRIDPLIEFFPSKYVKCELQLPMVNSPKENPEFVYVRNYKEKGSDVKLATNIIKDAIEDNFDIAAVFTNDSDFAEPLNYVRYYLHKKIILVLTCNGKDSPPSKDLQKIANYVKHIRVEDLANSQLEPIIYRSGKKPIYKPPSW
jgi:uncharacterized LabA/DUF88 family protein